jgi:hypothetical protein
MAIQSTSRRLETRRQRTSKVSVVTRGLGACADRGYESVT